MERAISVFAWKVNWSAVPLWACKHEGGVLLASQFLGWMFLVSQPPPIPSLPLVWLLSDLTRGTRPGPAMSFSFSSGLFFWPVSRGSNRHKGSIRAEPGGTAASPLLLLISGHLCSSDSSTRARRLGVQGRGPLAWGACCVPAPLGRAAASASAWK